MHDLKTLCSDLNNGLNQITKTKIWYAYSL